MEIDDGLRHELELEELNAARIRKVGAAAQYAASDLGRKEIHGRLGSSGPPTGTDPGASEAEQAEFFEDLTPTPKEVLA